jgi:uncharacterized membrane protein
LSSRTLRIALAASVALNLFAVAAGATVLIGRAKVEDRIEAQQRPQRDRPPTMTVVSRLSPEAQPRVKAALKAAALAARPEFDEARSKRREAVALASSETLDPARVSALLEQSRAAEIRGRARLEADAVRLLGTLEPADRAVLAEILNRRGRNGARDQRTQRPEARAADQGVRPPALPG